MTEPEYLNAFRQTDETMTINAARGYPDDVGYRNAKAIADQAHKVSNESEPLGITLPDLKGLRDYCADRAAERVTWRGRTAVATEVERQARMEAARFVRGATPAIVQRLADEVNTKILPSFLGLVETAPHGPLTGHEDADQLAAHSELLRAAAALSAAAMHRAMLAVSAGEGEALGHNGVGPLFINPESHAHLDAIDAANARLKTAIPTTLDGWSELVPLNLSFAGIGEAAGRLDRINTARAALVNTADRGMLPHSLGELLGES